MDIKWLWLSFRDLPWWAQVLWVAYLIYFLIRVHNVWDATRKYLWLGYREVFLGSKDPTKESEVKLYHILRIIFDIPPMILGILFPVVRRLGRMKLGKLKAIDPMKLPADHPVRRQKEWEIQQRENSLRK